MKYTVPLHILKYSSGGEDNHQSSKTIPKFTINGINKPSTCSSSSTSVWHPMDTEPLEPLGSLEFLLGLLGHGQELSA